MHQQQYLNRIRYATTGYRKAMNIPSYFTNKGYNFRLHSSGRVRKWQTNNIKHRPLPSGRSHSTGSKLERTSKLKHTDRPHAAPSIGRQRDDGGGVMSGAQGGVADGYLERSDEVAPGEAVHGCGGQVPRKAGARGR